MKKGNIVFKDFGKKVTDTENRDEALKAYICAIFDVPAIQFDIIVNRIDEKNSQAFINTIYNDIISRTERLLREK